MKKLAALLCLVSTAKLFAWNATGHKAITFLAWDYLAPEARARATQILRAHPDYGAILSKGLSNDPVDVARNAFVTASTWPDLIKGDPRFSDTPALGNAPVTAVPGFRDTLRHQSWHYINSPVPNGFANEPIDPVNAISALKPLLKSLHKDGPVTDAEIYALPWILHLVSDLHQPLHTVTRFYRLPGGKVDEDKGGNGCYLAEDRNLHALWDGALGMNWDEGPVARLAASIADHTPRPKKLDTKPETWVREGIDLSNSFVYKFSGDCSNRENPLALPPGYKVEAHKRAMQRAALAAYRLAEILNDKLGS